MRGVRPTSVASTRLRTRSDEGEDDDDDDDDEGDDGEACDSDSCDRDSGDVGGLLPAQQTSRASGNADTSITMKIMRLSK